MDILDDMGVSKLSAKVNLTAYCLTDLYILYTHRQKTHCLSNEIVQNRTAVFHLIVVSAITQLLTFLVTLLHAKREFPIHMSRH